MSQGLHNKLPSTGGGGVTPVPMPVRQSSLNVVVPPPSSVKLGVEEGELVLRWTKPEKFEYPCFYEICVYQSQGRELKWKHSTENTEYTFPKDNYSPIKYYFAYVCTIMNGGSWKSEPQKSSRQRLCKLTAKNRFYYDESRPLKKHHEVYIGYIKTPDDKIAVKVIGKNFREIEHLMKFSKTQRENVVTYRDWDKIRYNPRKIGIALELCHKDTLAEIIKKKLLKGKQLKKVMIHIMRGLSSIHENDILHRDLKPHNILCSRDGTIIKISDFGLSKQMEDGQSEAAKSQSICGTEGWGSPEHYGGKGKVMSKKSDIFSAGLIYYYILSEGKLIYEDVYKFIYEMTDKQIVTIPALHCEEAELATDLISKMLQCDQDRRPDCSEVLAHPYLWSDLKKIDFIHHVCTFIKRHLNEKEDTDVIIKEILSDLDSDPYDWHEKMLKSDKEGAQYLATRAKEGKYRTSSTKDLIRFIRNMDEHYPNYPELVSLFKNTRSSVWPYFSTLFPELLPKVFNTLHKHLSSMDEIPELTDIKSLLTEPAPYEHLVPFEDVPFKKRKL